MRTLSTSPAATSSANTRWPSVFITVGAGIVSAFQVGKATLAMPIVQADLSLSLAIASWLLSAFAIVGAIAGAPIGLGADRIGAKNVVIGGLLLQGVASAVGSLSDGAILLLASRALEGLGFLAVTVGAPTLLAQLVAERDRKNAFALWATFMPFGMTAALLSAPILSALGWRGFWIGNAAMLLAYTALVATSITSARSRAAGRSIIGDVRHAALSVSPWLLGGLFALFTAIFFALFGFLPGILTDRLGVSPTIASFLAAGTILASAGGNLVCGSILAKGARPWRVLMIGFGVLALGGIALFSDLLYAITAYALSIALSFVSGFIPVILIDAAPRHAPRSELVGATMGFAMQGNNLGLVIGPATAGWLAGSFGWSLVSVFVVALAVIAAGLVLLFRARPVEARAVA